MNKRSLGILLLLACGLPAGAYAVQAVPASAWTGPAVPQPMSVHAGQAPVDTALSRIIPAPYRIELDASVPKSLVLVWGSGNDWMHVLKQAVAPVGLMVQADWKTNTIRVLKVPLAPGLNAAGKVASVAGTNAAGSALYGSPMPTTSGPSPFGSAAPVGPAASSAPAAAPAVTAGAVARMNTSPLGKAMAGLQSAAVSPPLLPSMGAAFTIPAGEHLSDGLAQYAKTFGWQLRWQVPDDYVLDAPLPIPAMTLRNGLKYVLRAYQSQGGLMHDTFVLAAPNKVVVAKPTEAQEYH